MKTTTEIQQMIRIKRTSKGNIELIDDQYNPVAKMVWYPDGLSEKTARQLVTAHNTHEELLGAIRELLDMVTDSRTHGPEIDLAVKAIARAEAAQ